MLRSDDVITLYYLELRLRFLPSFSSGFGPLYFLTEAFEYDDSALYGYDSFDVICYFIILMLAILESSRASHL